MNNKNYKDLRLVYMGTPEFAVAPLEFLHKQGYNILAVITAPDKPAGRGMQLQQSAVKKYAVANNLPILQPEKLKAPEFIEALENLKADLQVVVAFRMLPEIVWNMPPMGTINLHASLLPQYRGAAPINWAIINGETKTGLTTFLLQHQIDTGNILLQEEVPIAAETTVGTLYQTLMQKGGNLLHQTIEGLCNNTINPKPQLIDIELKHAPKIFNETCLLNFENNSQDLHNLVRGLHPIPGAFTMVEGKKFKILKSVVETIAHNKIPGTMVTDNKEFLKFATGDGFLYAQEVQPEGKKPMPIKNFLAGWRPKSK
jgi:methionyl-tRNA formyltransferase